jgi:hypothetical protein
MSNWSTSSALGGWKFHACGKVNFNSLLGGPLLVRERQQSYLLEVRQETFPAPIRFLPKVGSPAVVVLPLSSKYLHTVDSGATAKNHTANHGNTAVVQARLGHRADVEGEGRVDQAPEAPRDPRDRGRIFCSQISTAYPVMWEGLSHGIRLVPKQAQNLECVSLYTSSA